MKQHNIKIDYINLCCFYQSAYIERINRLYSDEILDLNIFNSLHEVQEFTEDWIEIYYKERSYDSLNDMTPIEHKKTA